MKIIDLEQGSTEWLEFRRHHITSTDAAVIMGENKWKDERDLWNEKIGLIDREPPNAAMLRGTELEPIAKKTFIDRYFPGWEFPAMVVQSEDNKFMMTSLDGINVDEQIFLEIKCPSQRSHDKAKEGVIDPMYTCQIQHHFACTGYDQGWYVSYRPEHEIQDVVLLMLTRDDEFIERLIIKEKEFYRKLLESEEPKQWVFNNN